MKIVISCHYDTVFIQPYARLLGDGYLVGACDNIASILSVSQLIQEPDLIIEFTEEEEMHMDGARYVARKYDANNTFIIVTDVTNRCKSWKKINFTVENWHGIQDKHIKKALKEFNGHYKMIENGTESEAWLYKELGFACAEIDVPLVGGLHSLDSKARLEDILVASRATKAMADFVKTKTREELGDMHKVE